MLEEILIALAHFERLLKYCVRFSSIPLIPLESLLHGPRTIHYWTIHYLRVCRLNVLSTIYHPSSYDDL